VLFPSDGGHPCSAAATPHSSAAHLRPPQSFSARSARPSTRITSGRLNLSRRGAPSPVLGLHGGWRQEVKLTVVNSFRNAATAAAWTSAADGVRLRGGVGRRVARLRETALGTALETSDATLAFGWPNQNRTARKNSPRRSLLNCRHYGTKKNIDYCQL